MGSAFRSVPRTGVIYVTTEAQRARLPRRRSRLVQPRPGAARDGRRCPARRRASTRSTIDVDDQEYAPVPGIWELREAVAGLYNRLYRRGMPSQYTRGERLHLRRRARGAHPRRGQPRAHQPRPLPPRLHRLRGAARHLQGVHRRSRSCSRASAATRSPPTTCAARSSAAASRRCCCRTRATRPASSSAATSSRAGSRIGARARLHAALDEFYSHYVWTRAAPASCRSRAPRATSRTSIAIRSCSSTASPRTGATRAGACTWTVGPQARSSRRSPAPARSSTAAARKPLQRAAIPLLEDDARRSPRPTRSTPRSASKRDLHARRPRAPRRAHRPRRPTARSTSGATSADAARRRSTTAWASSAPRSSKQGHRRAGRVLRREPGQAPQPARLALPPPRALLLRPGDGQPRDRARAPRDVDRRSATRPEAYAAMFGSGVFAAPVSFGSPKPA